MPGELSVRLSCWEVDEEESGQVDGLATCPCCRAGQITRTLHGLTIALTAQR